MAADARRHGRPPPRAIIVHRTASRAAGGRKIFASGGDSLASAPVFRFRLQSVWSGRRRLDSRAIGRLWRFVVRARPFARIAPCCRLRSRHRRPCRATTCADSFLHSRPVACHSAHGTCVRRTRPLESKEGEMKLVGLRPPHFRYAHWLRCRLQVALARRRHEHLELRIEVTAGVVQKHGTHKISCEPKLFALRSLAPTLTHRSEALHFGECNPY